MQSLFPEHFQLSEDEELRVWKDAIFVFDTNILLHVYRLSAETTEQMFLALEAVKSSLFLPYQVGLEFFRNREEVIARQVRAFEMVRRLLRAALITIDNELTKDHDRHPVIPVKSIKVELKSCFEKQIKTVEDSQLASKIDYITGKDPLLERIARLFLPANCGNNKSFEAIKSKVAERFNENQAPCGWFTDNGTPRKEKPETNLHFGDGIIWFQILEQAAASKLPVIFVTDDGKPNWWRTVKLGNDLAEVGPHQLLIRDLLDANGKPFLIYKLNRFLDLAKTYLKINLTETARSEVQALEQPEPADSRVIEGTLATTIAYLEVRWRRVKKAMEKLMDICNGSVDGQQYLTATFELDAAFSRVLKELRTAAEHHGLTPKMRRCFGVTFNKLTFLRVAAPEKGSQIEVEKIFTELRMQLAVWLGFVD